MPFDITFSDNEGFNVSVEDSTSDVNIGVGEYREVPVIGPQGPKGDDGFSPIVSVSEITGGHEVAITDAVGISTFDVMDGTDGKDGVDGKDGADGKDGLDGKDGEDGKDGSDGVSPVASVTKSGDTATITITDVNGTTTATVSDGKDGEDGKNGKDGADGHDGTNGTDGVSPVANVSKSGSTATITITDAIGTTTATVNDGTNGADGKSAYQYAVDGGYTGTEQEFAAKLAAEYLTSESDPTVPSWAKASSKPTYTASEVGALPDTTSIPSKTSDLTNDSGYITGMTILSYGHSTWNDFMTAYNANKVVYCRASSGSNPASGSQTRLAFMAYVSDAANPTNVEFQYYRSVNQHSATQQGDQVYVYKLTSAGAWTVTVRESYTKIVAGTGLKTSYSNGALTISLE